MKTWTNKHTKNTHDFPDHWDNSKGNFTDVARSDTAIAGNVEDSWNESNQTWDIQPESQIEYDKKQTSIQAFIDSPFNGISITKANNYIDNHTEKESLKILSSFVIGLREVLREIIKKQ